VDDFTIDAPHGLSALERADTIVVPGWASPEIEPSAKLVAALRRADRREARIVSICTGAFVLAAAGLLDGRRATTHWLHTDALQRRYPRVQVDPGVLYVVDGTVMTSAGTAAGIDLCLHIVSCDYGADVAAAVSRRLLMPLHRSGGQAQYVDVPVSQAHGDEMTALLAWAMPRIAVGLSVDDLARHAAMSRRTLTRRFRQATGLAPASGSRASGSALRGACSRPPTTRSSGSPTTPATTHPSRCVPSSRAISTPLRARTGGRFARRNRTDVFNCDKNQREPLSSPPRLARTPLSRRPHSRAVPGAADPEWAALAVAGGMLRVCGGR